MVQPVSILIVGLVGFAFFAGIAVISNIFWNKTSTWWTTCTFIGFALLSSVVVYGYFVEEHEVSEEGLTYTSFAGIKKFLRWSDLRAVRYAPYMKWFRLETNSGSIARVSVTVTGLPEFARLLMQKAPKASIDAETVNVLRATSAGDPPGVWV
jgi:hypothetical protein